MEDVIRDREATNSATSTIAQYKHVLRNFRDRCGVLFVDQLGSRKIITDYILWLTNSTPRRTEGDQINNTVRDRLKKVSAFYKFHGVDFPLPKKEWPTEIEKEVTVYSPKDIERMLSKATEDEKDLILFFLYSGFRDREAACAYYSDIDWKTKTINVRPKPEWGFRIKNKKQRVIPVGLPDVLIERLKARMDRYSASTLIFPNSHNRPDDDLIEKVRNAARRAKMKDREVTLHRFRRTFGTRVAERLGVRNAQALLGHADLNTTTRYLAPTATPREAVNGLFDDVQA